jgi:hypothetical protein
MWEPQTLATLRASKAGIGITLPYLPTSQISGFIGKEASKILPRTSCSIFTSGNVSRSGGWWWHCPLGRADYILYQRHIVANEWKDKKKKPEWTLHSRCHERNWKRKPPTHKSRAWALSYCSRWCITSRKSLQRRAFWLSNNKPNNFRQPGDHRNPKHQPNFVDWQSALHTVPNSWSSTSPWYRIH